MALLLPTAATFAEDAGPNLRFFAGEEAEEGAEVGEADAAVPAVDVEDVLAAFDDLASPLSADEDDAALRLPSRADAVKMVPLIRLNLLVVTLPS